MRKINILALMLFSSVSIVACNSGGSSSNQQPVESYAYTSGAPYNFNYNLVNLQNVSVSGNSQKPVLTCNLSAESPSCSVTVKGNIGINGGGYIGLYNSASEPISPIIANGGWNPCPQDLANLNAVDCILSFNYSGNGQGNLYMQGASYFLMSKTNLPQLFLEFNLNPLP